MRFVVLFLLSLLALPLRALTVAEIVRLHEARVAEEVIVKWIEANDSEVTLTVADIIELQNKGIGAKVILALLQKVTTKTNESKANESKIAAKHKKKEKPRELSSFDRFFLSTYYSHEYGWPEPNYKNPQELLEAGLYYQPPVHYPHASRVRVYGWGYSYRPHHYWPYTVSPFSILVPREYVEKRSPLGLDTESNQDEQEEEENKN
jgi:hypothetical protein